MEAAINSILNQTFSNLEFIIIDDGSTDATWPILKTYAQQDSRILLVSNGKNLGLVNSLNKGLSLAKGKYIARMDADDISLPKRFAKQVAFMDANPEVGVCGSWIQFTGEVADNVWIYPTDDETICCCLLFDSGMAHPSVIMRKDVFAKFDLFYDPAYIWVEDHELWARSSKYCKLANIGEVLLLYRLHANQIGQRHKQEQISSAKRFLLSELETLGLQPTADELNLHQALTCCQFKATKDFVNLAHIWLKKIKSANDKTQIYNKIALSNVLGQRWFFLCNATTQLGWWIWETFWNSPFSVSVGLSWQQQLKFALKSQLKLKSNV
ncbi:glycosyltransferase family 2 protein [Cyanobacteria bacterium FACHB-472]|nr:glycosyltransferase family 2 protein [Cyanobacteria bacterium FACHB-472]